MFSVFQGSVSLHQTLDLESSGIRKWISWHMDGLWIEQPSLVNTIVAFVPLGMSFMSVRVSMNIKALSAVVSDVSVPSTVVGDLLIALVLVVSSDSRLSSVAISCSSRDSSSSIRDNSDGSCSLIESEPLFDVPRVVILDSQSPLMSSNVFIHSKGSLLCHS